MPQQKQRPSAKQSKARKPVSQRSAAKRVPVVIDGATGEVELQNAPAVRKPSAAVAPVQAQAADINGIFGGSGTGKTAFVIQTVRDRPRLLIWDTLGEFADRRIARPVTSIEALASEVRAGNFRLAYQPKGGEARLRQQFDLFCKIAFAASTKAAPVAVVAEELTDVTSAGHALEGWRRVSVMGRHRGMSLYGLSQSPAWVDKRFFGNCTRVRSGRLVEIPHAKRMAEVLGVPFREITGLPDLHWIERNMRTGEISRGVLQF